MIFKFAGRLAALGLVGMLAVGVHAQTAVLNFGTDLPREGVGGFTKFTFNDSMILNSIGWATFNQNPALYFYRINEGDFDFVNVGPSDNNNVAWFDFGTGLQVDAGDNIELWGGSGLMDLLDPGVSQVAGVTFNGFTGHDGVNMFNDHTLLATGNIKVTPTNPGSNVAPEPGTFALALTGGGALLGICVRRRRSAA